MPDPAYMKIHLDKKELSGPLTVCGEQNLWEIHEFGHQISGKEPDDPWSRSDWEVTHYPLWVVLEVGSCLPKLYAIDVGNFEYIDKIEIFWLQYSEELKKNHFYFKHTLYPVKITSIQMFMPNVKDDTKQHFNHLISIEFRYRWIAHLYTKGHLYTKAEWQLFLIDQLGEDIPLKYLTGKCLSDVALEWERMQKEKLKITSTGWLHKDETSRKESPNSVKNGDVIELQAQFENYVEGAGVDFFIFGSVSGREKQIGRVHTRCRNMGAAAEWTVDLSYVRLDNPELQFDCEARSKKSERGIIKILEKIRCVVVEVPDVHFNFDSPLPCLDTHSSLIYSLSAALKYADEHPGKESVLFGHTDTKGDRSYNFDLSKWRAEAVKALIDGVKDRWVDLADTQASIEDQQTFLSSLTQGYGWSCDPGPVDNADGPKTKSARKAFQRQFNEKYGGSLAVDGIFGEKSWGAMFEVQHSLLKETFKAETGKDALPKVVYGYRGKGVYPCGESFPIDQKYKDEYRSAENRRVEICFFDKGKAPRLLDHTNKMELVTTEENSAYDPEKTEKTIIKPSLKRMLDTCSLMVDEYSIENFRRLIGVPWDNNRIEVYDPADCIDKLFDPFNPCILPYKAANNDDNETDTPAILLDTKWLYAISSNGNSHFVSEAYATIDQDGTAKYQQVVWDNPGALKGVYPRKAGDKKDTGFIVPADCDTVVFISDHQLTYDRMEQYLSDKALLNKRGSSIERVKLKKDTAVAIVLPDILLLGEHCAYRHVECALFFNDFLERENKRQSEPTEANRRQFGLMLQQLADRYPVVKANIHYNELAAYNNKFEKDREAHKLELDWHCKMLCNWLRTEAYRITRDDYTGNEVLEETLIDREAAWTDNLLRTESGIGFIAESANDPESWYYKVNEGTIRFRPLLASTRFTNAVKEKLVGLKLKVLEGKLHGLIHENYTYTTQAQKYTWEAEQAFEERNAALQEFRSFKSKKGIITRQQLRNRKKLVKHEIEKLLKSHNLSSDIPTNIDFINEHSDQLIYTCGLKPTGKQRVTTRKAIASVKGIAMENGAKQNLQDAKKMRERAALAEFEIEETRGQLDSIKTGTASTIISMVFVAVEQINLILAVKNFRDSWEDGDGVKSTFDAINTFGALIDASRTCDLVVDALAAVETPAHSNRLWLNGLKKIKLTPRQIVLYKLDIISGICDMVVCGYTIVKYIEQGKYGQIIGEAIIFVGKALSVTAGICTLYGVKTIVFLGISSGGLGLIAAAIILAGALIAYLLREQKLRDWARQCPFNNLAVTVQVHDIWNKKEEPFNIDTYEMLTSKDIDIQRQKLFAILAEFDAEILTRLWRKPALPRQYRAFETFHLRIMPKAIQRDTSRFWVTIEIAANKHGLSSAFTVLKDAVTLDYANDSNGTADIDKYYNVKQIETRARKGNYYSEKLRDFLFVMANKEYVQKDVSLSDEMDGYYIYSDYTIKVNVKIRLDYDGDGERSLFDSNQESTGRMLIPVKGPFKIEKTNPKYEYV